MSAKYRLPVESKAIPAGRLRRHSPPRRYPAEARTAGTGAGSDHAGLAVHASNPVTLKLGDKEVSRAIQGDTHRMTEGGRDGRPSSPLEEAAPLPAQGSTGR